MTDEGLRVALDRRTAFWSGGRIAAGGSPWHVVRLGVEALPFVSELRRAGAVGMVARTRLETPSPGGCWIVAWSTRSVSHARDLTR